MTVVVPPSFSVTVGGATPEGGSMFILSRGTGNEPLLGPLATVVWKLAVTCPAGKCTVPDPGIGTSP